MIKRNDIIKRRESIQRQITKISRMRRDGLAKDADLKRLERLHDDREVVEYALLGYARVHDHK